MAGVQNLHFDQGCILEGAHFVDNATQMRHIWGFGGYLKFDKTGKLYKHSPGNHLACEYFPDINNPSNEKLLDITCFTQTPTWDLILINGQISYPQITKFIASSEMVELLEDELKLINEFGIVSEENKEEFIKVLDAYLAILNGEYDETNHHQFKIASYKNLSLLLSEEVSTAFQKHKDTIFMLADPLKVPLPIDDFYSWNLP